ncbi:MAG: TetR/AcrR family transcriptional regulator [Streptomyces sp.]|nr:TetR/AcrR family transcriptional regulator [Streptomyces sp.]
MAASAKKPARSRMTAAERREQLIDIARTLFAERGFDGASVEEIAARAEVSKPVVYEHFGGKEGVYAVVVDREVRQLLETDGFRIMVRDSPLGSSTGSYVSIMSDIASRVEGILVDEFKRRGFDAKAAPMYAQMLVGMVGMTGQWWLDTRKPAKEVVAAHLVNLAWNGLAGLEAKPVLRTAP